MLCIIGIHTYSHSQTTYLPPFLHTDVIVPGSKGLVNSLYHFMQSHRNSVAH